MIDTNILISMFLFPSDIMNRLKYCLCEQNQILICSYIVEEMKAVVARKFESKTKELDQFFQTIPFELTYTPENIRIEDYPRIRDVWDLPILASAILEDADIFLSGDKDFKDVDVERPEILTPTEFLEKYG